MGVAAAWHLLLSWVSSHLDFPSLRPALGHSSLRSSLRLAAPPIGFNGLYAGELHELSTRLCLFLLHSCFVVQHLSHPTASSISKSVTVIFYFAPSPSGRCNHADPSNRSASIIPSARFYQPSKARARPPHFQRHFVSSRHFSCCFTCLFAISIVQELRQGRCLSRFSRGKHSCLAIVLKGSNQRVFKIPTTAMAVLGLISTYKYALDRHVYDLEFDMAALGWKYALITEILFSLAAAFTKLSMLFLTWRLTYEGSGGLRKLTGFFIGETIVGGIIFITISIFQCTYVSQNPLLSKSLAYSC